MPALSWHVNEYVGVGVCSVAAHRATSAAQTDLSVADDVEPIAAERLVALPQPDGPDIDSVGHR